VVQLAEHPVVQVSQGRGVAVAAVAACQVVSAGWSLAAGGHEGPDEPDSGEAVVLDVAVCDADAAPGGFSDGCGPGEGFQCSRVGESCSVITNFGEEPGSGKVAEADERGDDPVVGGANVTASA
jgi:hypothetical protein